MVLFGFGFVLFYIVNINNVFVLLGSTQEEFLIIKCSNTIFCKWDSISGVKKGMVNP